MNDMRDSSDVKERNMKQLKIFLTVFVVIKMTHLQVKNKADRHKINTRKSIDGIKSKGKAYIKNKDALTLKMMLSSSICHKLGLNPKPKLKKTTLPAVRLNSDQILNI